MATKAAGTRSGAIPKKAVAAIQPGPAKNVGSDNWVKMAGGIERALADMRDMYEMLKHLQTLHVEFQCPCGQDPKNWEPLLRKTADVANGLKVALKARVYR